MFLHIFFKHWTIAFLDILSDIVF